ncbi:hypothetical protein [Methanolobus profundi]|uniref:Uncharacterized protein n=1 Tax=Methanolobus profundi TaxID=487685 RepID=A0A1I4T5E8_9EURY|nr:hypothetical protein [Methanolobus profundi]SFM71847.1 hypothetical protein SAMN04488696_2200 [Methanolobus profundi]
MQILIPDIVDTALISGVISVFLIADILVKNYLKINLRDVGADLAIGALVIQLGFIATILKGQQMDLFWSNIVLAICFMIFWVTCLWLAGKRDALTDMFSYTIGTFALAASIMHFLGTFRPTGMIILLAYSFILSVLAFLLADHLRTETVKQNYEKFTKDLQIYDMNESYRKLESGKGNMDPLQPVIDLTRGAIRNRDNFVATVGIRIIPEICSKVLASSGNKALIIKHLNIHLYQLAILSGEEKERFALMEVIDSFGSIGEQCAEADMESFVLHTMDSMNDFFDMYSERYHFPPLDKLSLIKRSKGPNDLVDIVTNKVVSTPIHELAIATGNVGIMAAKKEMLEPTENAVILLKKIALEAAASRDTATLENIRKVLLEFARTVDSKGQDHLKKLIVYALRDIGIKTIHESPDLKKHDCLDKVIETLREVGEIFGKDSILDVTAALKDIGIVAARKHSDVKVSRVIPVMEHFCTVAAESHHEDQASNAVNAILEVCEISIREQMVESTASSSKSLAKLSNIESVSVFVNEAVFELGKYREIDREMFALFDKTYRKSGGR